MSIAQASAQRRINDFQRAYGERALHLAYHAALPVALDADLLHLLRINFFLDPPEPLPFTAESDLLLSPLCQEIAEGLYEIEAETRNILLQGFALTYQQTDRLQEVATLLWRYVDEVAPWADRIELERAQQLTALSFLAPNQAQQWLTHAEQSSGRTMPVEREWFVAMGHELNRHKVTEISSATLDLALCDLRLPKEVIDLLTPIFHNLGFKLEGHKLYGANNLSLQFTVIHKDNEPERVLLHLPSWLIAETRSATIDKVAASTSIFDPETRVFIMCDGIDVLPLPYQNVVDEIWVKHRRLQATFVPWRVVELIKKASNELDSVLLVDSQFKLNIARVVSGESRTQGIGLRKVLASLYDNKEDALRVVAESGMDLTRIDFSGSSQGRWHNILIEAEKAGKLLPLLHVILDEYPKHNDLRKTAQYWLDPVTPSPPVEAVAYDIFISYNRLNMTWVQTELLPRLEAAGLRVCIDFRDFAIGTPIITEVTRAIRHSRYVLLVLTPNYLAKEWNEFSTELDSALADVTTHVYLIPLMLESCEIPLRIRNLIYLDFSHNKDLKFEWNRLFTIIHDGINPSTNVKDSRNFNLLSNPFTYRGRINDPARFFDRQTILHRIQQILYSGNSISLIGESEMGKSSLLYYIFRNQQFWPSSYQVIYLDLQGVLDEKDFYAEILRVFNITGNDLITFRRILSEHRLLLLLDEGEILSRFSDRLQNLLRALIQKSDLILIIASQRPLKELFLSGPSSPLYNVFSEIRIGPFSEEESYSFLLDRLKNTGIRFTDTEFTNLYQRSNGQPGLLQRLAEQLFALKTEQINKV